MERLNLKQKSLANEVLFLILSAIILVSSLITIVGASLIYDNTKKSIENEIVSAANTLKLLFEKEYPGDLNSSAYFIYRFGEKIVVAEDFYKQVEDISCSEDMEFTVFYGDMRIFTTIVNPSGSTPVGTRAADYVIEAVINNKTTRVFDNIDINGAIYMGCYIPIISGDGSVSGMYFAGKPIELANSNARKVITGFILVAVITAALSLVFCIVFTEKMIKDLRDIKQYINKVAEGDFSAQLRQKTLERNDEISEIGQHAQTLCSNLRDMVERDPLTALLNRRSCRMKLDEIIENNIPYTAVMADIDYFKSINDTYGHACGDFVLKEVSAVLKSYAAESKAFTARWGGEEFLMIFPKMKAEDTIMIVRMIHEAIHLHDFSFDNNKIKVSLTFGIAGSEPGETADITINRADKLLYKGKENGRDRIMI